MLIYLKSRTLHVHVWTYCHFTSFTLNLRLSGDHVYCSEWVTRFYGMEMLTQKTQFQPHCDWDQGLPVVLINVHWFVSLSNRLDQSGENFPKSILTMIYGWENASGSAFIKGKNSKNCPAIVGWRWSFKLDLAPAQ